MASKSIKLAPNQILLKEGDHSSCMYWLQKGQLVAFRVRAGEEVVLGHIYSGELVGEISFLDNEPRTATVRAITDCELIEIPKETIDGIYRIQPKWLEILVKTLAERLRKANARIKV